MYFDRLCKVHEKWLQSSEVDSMLREARIFYFDYDPTEYIGSVEDLSPEVYEQFHLPFPCVALEDKVSVVVLQDQEEHQTGPTGTRRFIELVRKGERFTEQIREVSRQTDLPEIHDAVAAIDRGEELWEIYWGQVHIVGTRGFQEPGTGHRRTSMQIDPALSTVNCMLLGSRTGPIHQPYTIPLDARDSDGSSPLRNILAAYDELAATYTRKHFVLETSPAKPPKNKGKKLSRAYQRPQYTILKPQQIRDRLGLVHPQGTTGTGRKSPAPHERRRHLRRLTRASGYKEDKTIVISAVWVGPSEAVVGNKKYRVIL